MENKYILHIKTLPISRTPNEEDARWISPNEADVRLVKNYSFDTLFKRFYTTDLDSLHEDVAVRSKTYSFLEHSAILLDSNHPLMQYQRYDHEMRPLNQSSEIKGDLIFGIKGDFSHASAELKSLFQRHLDDHYAANIPIAKYDHTNRTVKAINYGIRATFEQQLKQETGYEYGSHIRSHENYQQYPYGIHVLTVDRHESFMSAFHQLLGDMLLPSGAVKPISPSVEHLGCSIDPTNNSQSLIFVFQNNENNNERYGLYLAVMNTPMMTCVISDYPELLFLQATEQGMAMPIAISPTKKYNDAVATDEIKKFIQKTNKQTEPLRKRTNQRLMAGEDDKKVPRL